MATSHKHLGTTSACRSRRSTSEPLCRFAGCAVPRVCSRILEQFNSWRGSLRTSPLVVGRVVDVVARAVVVGSEDIVHGLLDEPAHAQEPAMMVPRGGDGGCVDSLLVVGAHQIVEYLVVALEEGHELPGRRVEGEDPESRGHREPVALRGQRVVDDLES